MLFANNHDATTLKQRQTRFLSRVFVAVALTGLGLTVLLALVNRSVTRPHLDLGA